MRVANRMRTYVVRGPAELCREMDSRSMTRWLGDFLRQPDRLGLDPGSGEYSIALYLPVRAVRALMVLTDETAAASLRMLAASHLCGLPSAPRPPVSLPVRLSDSAVSRPAPSASQALARTGSAARPSAIFDSLSGQYWNEGLGRWMLPGVERAPFALALTPLHGQKCLDGEPDANSAKPPHESAEPWSLRAIMGIAVLVGFWVAVFVFLFWGACRSHRGNAAPVAIPVEPWAPEVV